MGLFAFSFTDTSDILNRPILVQSSVLWAICKYIKYSCSEWEEIVQVPCRTSWGWATQSGWQECAFPSALPKYLTYFLSDARRYSPIGLSCTKSGAWNGLASVPKEKIEISFSVMWTETKASAAAVLLYDPVIPDFLSIFCRKFDPRKSGCELTGHSFH